MKQKNKRPINLDLTKLKYPAMAIASILHRLSGILLFILLPVMIYFLNLSITSKGFEFLINYLKTPVGSILIWSFCSALIYHVFAGIRHIIMDIGFGESLAGGRKSALFVIIIAAICIIGLGVYLC